jgi:hypothetical protein
MYHVDYRYLPNVSSFSRFPMPVSTVERSFSPLRRLKTWLRPPTMQERLKGQYLIYVEITI